MSQSNRLEAMLLDGYPHRTDEIMRVVYGADHLGIARIASRITDLKDRGHVIVGWKDEERPSLYWYQITKAAPEKSLVKNVDIEKLSAIAKKLKLESPQKERTLFA